jgi:hypothetical protein
MSSDDYAFVEIEVQTEAEAIEIMNEGIEIL